MFYVQQNIRQHTVVDGSLPVKHKSTATCSN